MVFDLDGTLLDTLGDLAAAGNRICAAFGWPQHPLAAYRRFVGNGIPKLVERIAPPDGRGAGTQRRALAAFEADYAAHMQDTTAPYPGIPPMLAALKAAGVRMAVLSNKDDALARRIVAHYFGADTFLAVRGALPGLPAKPDPAALLALLQALRAAPGTVLVAGDSDVDVRTARSADLPCCGVLWGFRDAAELSGAGAAYLAPDPAALARIVLDGAQ